MSIRGTRSVSANPTFVRSKRASILGWFGCSLTYWAFACSSATTDHPLAQRAGDDVVHRALPENAEADQETQAAAARSEAPVMPQTAAESPFPNAVAGEERTKPSEMDGAPNEIVRQVVAPSDRKLDKTEASLGTVFGLYSEAGRNGRYSWVVDSKPTTVDASTDEAVAKKAELPLAVVESAPRITAGLSSRLESASADELVPVVITLNRELSTSLEEPDLTQFTSFDAKKIFSRQELQARRVARIDERRSEADQDHAALKTWLVEQGIPEYDVGDFWAVNAVSALVPAWLVPALSDHPDVARVEFDHPLNSTTSDRWDGANVKSSTGLNAGLYVNNGFDGDRVNPKHGFPLSIGVLDFLYADDHPVFQHSPGVSKIVGRFTCSNGQPCVGGLPTPPANEGVHGSWCASAAAGAAMNGQIGGTLAEKRDRTGVAEQTELTFISTGAISDTIRGLQQAVSWASDVVTESFGGGDGVCDGVNAGWESAVYDAHNAGVLVVGAAGNETHPPDRCTLTGLSEVPSQFVVGGLNDPGTGAYSTAAIAEGSSGGGVDVTINGSPFRRVFTGVDAVVPAHWSYAAGKNGTFDDVGGTSLAAPQVAGVAALFKDWMIGNGLVNQANSPGMLYANLLAMTDRQSSSGLKSAGFDPVWGGGRLQSRYFAAPDHPSGLVRWEFANYTIGANQHIQHRVAGVGNEPGGIRTFKIYAVFFERDGIDVADVDMSVYDKGCGAGKALLGSDLSRDMKSMVSIGSAGANKDVCVDLHGFHVPAGETRNVVLVAYYTGDTSMR